MNRILRMGLSLLFIGGSAGVLVGCGSAGKAPSSASGVSQPGDTAWTFQKAIATPIQSKATVGGDV